MVLREVWRAKDTLSATYGHDLDRLFEETALVTVPRSSTPWTRSSAMSRHARRGIANPCGQIRSRPGSYG
jgi:hypothetical protein